VAVPAHRGALPPTSFSPISGAGQRTPTPDNGTKQGIQGALAFAPPTRCAPRRVARRRTGPCTVSYRLVAARTGARPVVAPTWLRSVRASPQVADLRADSARTVLEVAAVLALAARPDATCAPTWPVLVERSGYSRATVARVLAWLRAAQLLITLENGSTEQFRPRPRPRRDRPASAEVEGNRAAVYLLTEPLPEVNQVDWEPDQSEHYASSQASTSTLRNETPPGFSRSQVRHQPRTGARMIRKSSKSDTGAGPKAAPSDQGPAYRDHLVASRSATLSTPEPRAGYRRGPRGTKGAQRAADLAVAEALRARSLDLRALSAKAIRSAARSQLADGWGVEDLVQGIDHAPDGTPRTYTAGPAAAGAGPVAADVGAERRRRGVVVDGGARPARAIASPGGWLAWRLADWAGLPPPVATRQAEAAARSAAARTAAAARRAAAATAAAAAVPPPPVLAEARAALRARRGA